MALSVEQVVNGLVLGNYVVLDKIGAGGMGQVFKAQHRRMKRIVALKVLPPAVTKDTHAVERFQREVEAAAKLSHPNIVTAHDADEAEGVHFLVMEWVDASDLASLVQKKGPLAVALAVQYLVQVARGLEYAHNKGVVHRDIKPANLLVDAGGTVKILDMGLARFTADEQSSTAADLTGTGAIMGTVAYMAPEQARDSKHADRRADVYSLGCTLFYLLTGRTPYQGSDLLACLLAHQEQPIPSLQAERPDVPQGLEEIFRKMLAKQPEDRYQSMSQVLAALQKRDLIAGDLPPCDRPRVQQDAATRRLPPAIPVAGGMNSAGAQGGRGEELLADVKAVVVQTHSTDALAVSTPPPAEPRAKAAGPKRRPLILAAAALAAGVLLVLGLALALWLANRSGPAGMATGPTPAPGQDKSKGETRSDLDKDKSQPVVKPPDTVKLPDPNKAPDVVQLGLAGALTELKPLPGTVRPGDRPLTFSPDGRFVAAHSLSHVYLWDLTTGQDVSRIEDLKIGNFCGGVAFSSDGQQVLVGHADWHAVLYDVPTGKERKRFKAPSTLCSVALSADGRYVAAGCGHSTAAGGRSIKSGCLALMWETDSGKEVYRSRQMPEFVTTVSFSADSRRLLYATARDYAVYQIAGKTETERAWGFPVFSISFCGDGRRALVYGSNRLKLFDLQLDRPIGPEIDMFSIRGCFVAVSADGKRAVVGWNKVADMKLEVTVRLINLESSQELGRTKPLELMATAVAISPDGTRAVYTSADKNAPVFVLDLTRINPADKR